MSPRRDSDIARLEQLRQERRNQQEADERPERETRCAQEERRNRKEADKKAPLERQHADDERRHLEESFEGTEHCGLCRLQLPWANLSCLEAWESSFRAILCLDPNDEDFVELTSLASFSNVHNDRIAVQLTGHRYIQEITIVRRRQNSQKTHTGRIAFCFHNWCYEILMWNVRNCTKSEIYRLARTLSLNQVASENWYGDRGLSVSTSDHTLRWLEEKSSCRVYPFFLSQLPAELRHSIWEYVSPIAASNAFALVEGGTSLLVRALNCSNCRNISLGQGSFISFKMITVFGTAYIQDLDNKEGSKVIPGVVTRLIFAMSLDGICAIKLLGIDWDTGWLGEIPNTGCIWYGTLQDIGSSLTCSYNDLYCTRLSSLGASVTSPILWDQPDLPSSLTDPDAALFDFDRDLIDSSRSMLQKHQPRFFGYLPLSSGSVYISGLTVYLSGNGIIGLEAHFTGTSQLSGSRNGCPKYFPLHPCERIACAWLRIANSRSPMFTAPALTIQTTLGRSYSFGPFVLPQLVMANRYKWILLRNRGCITGFYYEKPIARPVIMRLGVIADGNSELKAHQSPQFPACDSPYLPLVGPDAGLFLSIAVLSDLKKVELCRVSNRCTGVMISYLKALPVVLGQWHTSHSSQQICIYDSNRPSTVSEIYFRTSKSGDRQVVTDISFSVDKSKDCDYQAFSTEKPIAWWYSKLDDVICYWEGRIFAIPDESITKLT